MRIGVILCAFTRRGPTRYPSFWRGQAAPSAKAQVASLVAGLGVAADAVALLVPTGTSQGNR